LPHESGLGLFHARGGGHRAFLKEVPVSALPSSPDLSFEKKQAKALLRDCRAGDPSALARVNAHLPKLATTGTDMTLADAQFVIYHSAQHNRQTCLELMLARGADLSGRQQPYGNTPLYLRHESGNASSWPGCQPAEARDRARPARSRR
jgi:hypothetical protein